MINPCTAFNYIKFLEILNSNNTANIFSTNQLKITFKHSNFVRKLFLVCSKIRISSNIGTDQPFFLGRRKGTAGRRKPPYRAPQGYRRAPQGYRRAPQASIGRRKGTAGRRKPP